MARTRSIAGVLKRLMLKSPRPIYTLDSDRTLTFANPACESWVGLSLAEMLDVRCDYHSQDDEDTTSARLAGLCPPPQTFRGNATEAIVHLDAGDEVKRRRGWFLPLGSGNEAQGVLGLLADSDLPLVVPDEATLAEASAASLHELLADLRQEMRPRYAMEQFVGKSPAITRAREQMRIAVASRCRTLIVGPAGSGREHVARTIFYEQKQARGDQAVGPSVLVPLACPLLDAELLETTFSAT